MKVQELFESNKSGFTVLFSFIDDDKNRATGSVKITGVSSEDKARNRAKTQLGKYKGLKITRVTALKEDLAEGYTPPTKNPKLRFSASHKIPVGGTKEWLKAFGATQEHIDQANRILRQSVLVKRLAALGLHDESTDRHRKLGSMMFIGTIAVPTQPGYKPRVKRMKFTIQANGKIDETAPNDHHRAPVGAKKPHIVPGDPVSSIVKTVSNSLEKLIDNMEKRREKEKKVFATAAKK